MTLAWNADDRDLHEGTQAAVGMVTLSAALCYGCFTFSRHRNTVAAAAVTIASMSHCTPIEPMNRDLSHYDFKFKDQPGRQRAARRCSTGGGGGRTNRARAVEAGGRARSLDATSSLPGVLGGDALSAQVSRAARRASSRASSVRCVIAKELPRVRAGLR